MKQPDLFVWHPKASAEMMLGCVRLAGMARSCTLSSPTTPPCWKMSTEAVWSAPLPAPKPGLFSASVMPNWNGNSLWWVFKLTSLPPSKTAMAAGSWDVGADGFWQSPGFSTSVKIVLHIHRRQTKQCSQSFSHLSHPIITTGDLNRIYLLTLSTLFCPPLFNKWQICILSVQR